MTTAMGEPLPLRARLPWCPGATRPQRKVLVAQAVRRERLLLAMLRSQSFMAGLHVPF